MVSVKQLDRVASGRYHPQRPVLFVFLAVDSAGIVVPNHDNVSYKHAEVFHAVKLLNVTGIGFIKVYGSTKSNAHQMSHA